MPARSFATGRAARRTAIRSRCSRPAWRRTSTLPSLPELIERSWAPSAPWPGLSGMRRSAAPARSRAYCASRASASRSIALSAMEGSKSYSRSSSSASSTARFQQGTYFSRAFFARRASRAMSSAVKPRAARRKPAISRGRSRMMSVSSDATRPASANSSSASCPMIAAIFMTLSSAGGANSSRSTFDM